MTFYYLDQGHGVLVVIDPAPPSLAVAIATILFRAGMLVRVPLEQRITAKVFEEKWQHRGEKMNMGIANSDYMEPLIWPLNLDKTARSNDYVINH